MLSLDGILFDTLAADPSSPSEGQMWFNTATHQFGMYRNGSTSYFADMAALTAHISNTSNPHSTTLEQARTAGSTLAGPINMGGFGITNVPVGSADTDVAQRKWVADTIKAQIQGLDFQDPVINETTNTPPASPVLGDRYIVGSAPTGVWALKALQIAQWNGTAWDFTVPLNGYVVLNVTTGRLRMYSGSLWQAIEQTLTHASLLGLTADDHTQYVLASGTRAFTGDQSFGAHNLTSVGNINGVSITAHAARHQPGGSDALATASAVGITDATNGAGSSTNLALADHVHAHGTRGGGTLHAVASSTGAGFKPQSNLAATANPIVGNDNTQGYAVGSTWVNTTNGTCWVATSVATGAAVWKELTNVSGVLAEKAGKVLAASFSGSPKKATVTFATAFTDANYAVALTPVIATNGSLYAPNIESQLAGSFVINMGTSSVASLTQVNWSATKNGESA
jgi:hypothetical protein